MLYTVLSILLQIIMSKKVSNDVQNLSKQTKKYSIPYSKVHYFYSTV